VFVDSDLQRDAICRRCPLLALHQPARCKGSCTKIPGIPSARIHSLFARPSAVTAALVAACFGALECSADVQPATVSCLVYC